MTVQPLSAFYVVIFLHPSREVKSVTLSLPFHSSLPLSFSFFLSFCIFSVSVSVFIYLYTYQLHPAPAPAPASHFPLPASRSRSHFPLPLRPSKAQLHHYIPLPPYIRHSQTLITPPSIVPEMTFHSTAKLSLSFLRRTCPCLRPTADGARTPITTMGGPF